MPENYLDEQPSRVFSPKPAATKQPEYLSEDEAFAPAVPQSGAKYLNESEALGEPVKERGALGEIGTGLKRGVIGELPKMVGQATKWASEKGSKVYDVGQSIVESAEERLDRPENQLQPDSHNVVTNALASGAEMLAPSIAIPAAVGIGAASLPGAAVSGAVGLGAAAVAGAVPMGMAQAQETMENVEKAGGTHEAARVAGWKSGAIETGGETIGTYLGGKLLGIGGKLLGNAAKDGIGGIISNATDKALWKPYAKQLFSTAIGETATEIGQSYGQATIEKNAGVDVDPLEQAAGVIAPTLGMTALLAPFGLAGHFRNSQRANAVDKMLADPNAAPPEARLAVVDMLHDEAVKSNVPGADAWFAGAVHDIGTGAPVRRAVSDTLTPFKPEPRIAKALAEGDHDANNRAGAANIIWQHLNSQDPVLADAWQAKAQEAINTGAPLSYESFIGNEGKNSPDGLIQNGTIAKVEQAARDRSMEVRPDLSKGFTPTADAIAKVQQATTDNSTNDLMFDFAEQAEAGQANEDTKYRKARFEKMRGQYLDEKANQQVEKIDNQESLQRNMVGVPSSAQESASVLSSGSTPAMEEAERLAAKRDDSQSAFSDRDALLPRHLVTAINKMEYDLANNEGKGDILQGSGNNTEKIGEFPSTNPKWFKQKYIKAYDKEHGTNYAGAVNSRNIKEALYKVRNGLPFIGKNGKPATEQQKAWEYIQAAAEIENNNDPELVANKAFSDLEKEGFEFDSPRRVNVGNMQKGDSVVVLDKNGIPEKLTHKGRAANGNIVIQDGIRMEVDEFDVIPDVIADKKGEQNEANRNGIPSADSDKMGGDKQGAGSISDNQIIKGANKKGGAGQQKVPREDSANDGESDRGKDAASLDRRAGSNANIIPGQKPILQGSAGAGLLGVDAKGESNDTVQQNRNTEPVQVAAKTEPTNDNRGEAESILPGEVQQTEAARGQAAAGARVNPPDVPGDAEYRGKSLGEHMYIGKDGKRYFSKYEPQQQKENNEPDAGKARQTDIRNIGRTSRPVAPSANGNTETITNPDSIANGQEVNTAPTEGQKEAENYKTAKVSVDGLSLSIENPAGSTRSGTDQSGKQWSVEMKNDYGRILGSMGYDKDHVDIFIAPGYKGGAKYAYVVNQHNKDGRFDEHKTVLGVDSEQAALDLYNSNYEKGWTGSKSVTRMPLSVFRKWVTGDGPAKGELRRARTVDVKELKGGDQKSPAQPAGKKQVEQTAPDKADRTTAGKPSPEASVTATATSRDTFGGGSVKPTLNEEGRRTDGKAILPGDVFTTATGRETTPYPKYSPKRTRKADIRKANQWLIDNYMAEAKARNDDFNQTLAKGMDAGNFSQADGEGINLYLFGKQADLPGAETVTNPSEKADSADVSSNKNATPNSYGAKNKVFTKAAADEALEILRAGLKNLNSGIPPEMVRAGIIRAGYHIESGIRSFADYSAKMIEELGEAIQPYLRQFYEAVRWEPGFDSTGMSTAEEIDSINKGESTPDKQATFADLYYNDDIKAAAEDLVASRSNDEIIKKIDSIFGTVEEVEQAEQGNGEYTVMHDIALDRRADLEHAARNRYLEETQDILEAIRGEERSLTDGAGQTERSRDVQSSPGVQNKKEETPESKIAKGVIKYLKAGTRFTSKKLFNLADEAYGGTQAQGKYTPKDAYDSLELGINKYLADGFRFKSNDPAGQIKELENLLSLVPTQTKRTKEQDDFQQYSTPPTLSYVANWVANLKKNDSYVEPSAGIGGLAVFAKIDGVQNIVVNEYSERRREILKEMGFDEVYGENAEQLNNVLPDTVKPTVVVMNPPFSATGGRLSKNKTKYGALHIEQALKRLEPGGRLVAIVGEGMADDRATFRKWWSDIKKEYSVLANVGMNGEGYRKYGTTFDNQLLVIDKTGPTTNNVITGKVDSYTDLIPLLQGVRDARTAITQQKTSEQAGKGKTQTGGSGAGQKQTVPPITPSLVPGQRETENGSGDRGRNRPDASMDSEGMDGGSDQSGARGRGANTDQRQEPEAGATGLDGAGQDREPTEGTDKLETSRQKKEQSSGDSIFEGYQPTIRVSGSKPHPADLVESAAMAAVHLPEITYQPSIPKETVTSGKLSEVQLEAITAAGQAHQDTLPNGERRGFFIGDGTGVGKGREIAGILLDNWNQGRKRSIWISKDRTLAKDAKRDMAGIGWSDKHLIEQGSVKAGQAIPDKNGVLYTAYSTVSTSAKEGQLSRLQAIIDWAGPDFDGVIAFDESHKMGNAVSIKEGRYTKKPSQMALAALDLQRALPKARIVYVSATGATEVSNLAYAERLGLWGQGTAFENVVSFIGKVSQGGIAAMEVVARDMKAMGSYLARKLAYNGNSKAYQVKYRRLEHQLSGSQREIYDELAGAWQIVLSNIDEALQITEADSNGRSHALSAFWGSHQRFFNQVLTAMQMPSVITSIRKDIDDGKAVVLQITNTNEASTNRALANAESLEDVDITPRDQLMQMIENSFPVQQYEKYEDENGNERTRPVVDSNGNPVVNREAVQKRERLLDTLGGIKVPDAPLDQILNVFGVDQVAEVTGRSKRIVTVDDGTGPKKVRQGWSKTKGVADAASFMADKKKILIFSEAGGTGASYHADLAAKNQRQRSHYILQAGWRADSAVQGLGRSHRSNQAIAPEYVLVTTDLKGHRRFISSIARRLSQLGALTEGERAASSQGLFTERDNLESQYASDAVIQLIHGVHRGVVPGISMDILVRELGLPNLVDEHGQLNTTQIPTVPRFLNRILSMKIDMQNKVFDLFSSFLDSNVSRAEEDGTLDTGLETLRAKAIRVVDSQPVYTDQKSGAVTEYVQLDVDYPTQKREYNASMKTVVNNQSGKAWQIAGEKSVTNENGDIADVFVLVNGRGVRRNAAKSDFSAKFTSVASLKESRRLWDKSLSEIPDVYTQREHLITGALLPIWDKLKGHPRIVRVQTENDTMLGRIIPGENISEVMALLDVEGKAVDMSPEQVRTSVLSGGQTLTLDNGWKIKRSKVADENRIEIVGPGYNDFDVLSNTGAFTERINYKTRVFIPTGKDGDNVIKSVLSNRKIMTVTGGMAFNDDISEAPAYHGSPHRGIEKFDNGKFLTGEGAMVYGAGHYFASRKEVADWYREKLTPPVDVTFDGKPAYTLDWLKDNTPEEFALRSVGQGKSVEGGRRILEKISKLDKDYADALKWFDENIERIGVKAEGQLYKVEVPEDDELLFWDKPLSEQPEKVKELLIKAIEEKHGEKERVLNNQEKSSGAFIYKSLSVDLDGYENTSNYLLSLGIKGIKYFDGMSRSQGEGAYNFVIFDGNDIQITDTYYSPKSTQSKGQKQETTLRELISKVQTESTNKLTQQLAKLLGQFIPGSKLDTKVLIDPSAKSASYTASKNLITIVSPNAHIESLHEIVHAVTVNEMESNPLLKAKVTRLMNKVRRDVVKQGIISQKKMDEISAARTSSMFKSLAMPIGLNGVENIGYAFLNEKEFLAQAFSSKQFQQVLEGVKVRQGGTLKSAWDAFVETIMKALGIKVDHSSAFSEAIKIVAELAGVASDKENLSVGGVSYSLGGSGMSRQERARLIEREQNRSLDALEVLDHIDALQQIVSPGVPTFEVRFKPRAKDGVMADVTPGSTNITFFGDVSKDTIEHELAHALVNFRNPKKKIPFHGDVFNATLQEVRKASQQLRNKIKNDDISEALTSPLPAAITSPFAGTRNKALSLLQKYVTPERAEKLATYLWDQDAAIARVQKEIGPQPEARDYNLLRRLTGKKVADEIKLFDRDKLTPLLKDFAKVGVKFSDTDELAWAEHAPERNLQMKRVNAKRYIDSFLGSFTGTEQAKYNDMLSAVQNDFVMKKQDISQKRDGYVRIMDEMSMEVRSTHDAQSAEIDKLQDALDNRTFTAEETLKGTPERAQKRIDNARWRLQNRLKIAEKWEDVKDRLSGMTDAKSTEIIKKWKADSRYPEIRRIVDKIREINEAALDMNYAAGELTDEEYQNIKKTYKYHVPLYREDMDSGKKAATGRVGVGPLASPIKIAAGSTRNVVNVFSHVVDRYQSAINRKHKLEAGRALYDMVVSNPDEDRWSIGQPDKKPYMDREGNIRFYEDRVLEDNEVYVKVDGKKHIITVPKDNKSMMRWMEALKREPVSLGPILKVSQKFNRLLAQLNTSFSPEFIISNFARDIQTAGIHLETTAAAGLQKKVFKNIKSAIKGIYLEEREKDSGEWGKLYRSFAKNGGKIGWMQGYENVEELAKNLESELAYQEGQKPKRAKYRELSRFVEAMNVSVENGVRLSTYKALLDAGVSERKAAHTVANLTVDFTRHGTIGPMMNSLYMFANAGIQGNIRMISAIYSNKKVQKIAGGIVGLGFMVNILGAYAGGDDDDGESFYDKLKRTNPDIFERNMVFMIPGGKGAYIKIPMPYGYNVLFVAGNEIGSAFRQPVGYSAAEGMARFGSSLMGTFNPLGSATLLQTIMPTMGDPIAQVMENKAWNGQDLMPSKNPFGIPTPDSERFWKSVNPAARFATRWLNSITGGNETKPGLIDVSPETVEMIVETMTGSLGRVIKDTVFLPISLATDGSIETYKIPFARKVYGSTSDYIDQRVFRENKESVEQFSAEFKLADSQRRAEMRRDDRYRLMNLTKTTNSRLTRLRKQLKKYEERGDDANVDRIKEHMKTAYKRYNARYNQTVS